MLLRRVCIGSIALCFVLGWTVACGDDDAASDAVAQADVDVDVWEYAIQVPPGLSELTHTVSFVIENDGRLEHEIGLLWLADRIPTEGFFFGGADAWPPFLEPYGEVRIAPGQSARLTPRSPLTHRDGRYVLFCTLGERGPSHAQLGMLRELPAR